MKTKIERGFTNISYKVEEDKKVEFFQEINRNGVNHKIDYSILKVFDFVPKLLDQSENSLTWDFVQGADLKNTDEELVQIANILKTIHESKLKFPPFNHRTRVDTYRKQLQAQGKKIKVIDDYFKRINLILKNMDKGTPTHNDPFWFNFIKDGNQKIWLVDWEYSSMGDKHFDLAYYIESSHLSDAQEDVLLDAYGKYDYEKVIQQKIMVNYLVVLWVNVQPTKYFDDQQYIDKIYYLDKYLEEYRQKHNLK